MLVLPIPKTDPGPPPYESSSRDLSLISFFKYSFFIVAPAIVKNLAPYRSTNLLSNNSCVGFTLTPYKSSFFEVGPVEANGFSPCLLTCIPKAFPPACVNVLKGVYIPSLKKPLV
jgi:hypothetical protein